MYRSESSLRLVKDGLQVVFDGLCLFLGVAGLVWEEVNPDVGVGQVVVIQRDQLPVCGHCTQCVSVTDRSECHQEPASHVQSIEQVDKLP